MKILFHDYGGYHFTYQLAWALLEKGHTVNYAYSKTTQQLKRFSDKRAENLEVTGVTLDRAFDKYNYFQRWFAERDYGKRVASEIVRFKPDVVLSANTPLDAQRIIQKASKKVGVGFVFWLQDAIGLATTKALENKLPLLGKVIGFYYQQLEKRMLRKSQGVILISEHFLPLMARWGVPKEKTAVIPNWAPLDQIPPQPHDNSWSEKVGLSQTFNFLYTGVLGLKHDPAIFLSLAEHFAGVEDVRVVVVSKGERFEWLKSEGERRGLKNLILLDFQPTEVYPQVLGSADVLVSILSPDAGEYSVPSKVLSYLCAQRPILLSVPLDNLASRIVLNANAGLVAAPGDNKGFLEKAQELYKNPEMRYDFSRSGREYAEEAFDIARIYQKFEAIIFSLDKLDR